MNTKTPTNYIEAEVEASNMISDFSNQMRVLESAINQIVAVRDGLDRMTLPAPQGYNSLNNFLAQKASENPDSEVWQALAMRMQIAATEFYARRQEVIDLVNAINP